MITSLPAHAGGKLAVTHDQLANAFDRVRDSRDWKAPIRAEIDESDRPVVELAVIRFTATVPAFEPVPGRKGRLTVIAAGYGRGPWGQSAAVRQHRSQSTTDLPEPRRRLDASPVASPAAKP